jgi:hypothetical protein
VRFGAELSASDRQLVHALAEELGLGHERAGEGAGHAVHVWRAAPGSAAGSAADATAAEVGPGEGREQEPEMEEAPDAAVAEDAEVVVGPALGAAGTAEASAPAETEPEEAEPEPEPEPEEARDFVLQFGARRLALEVGHAPAAPPRLRLDPCRILAQS